MFLLRFFCTLVFLCSLSTSALATQATFSWLPNTEANLDGYKIHYGTTSGNYTDVIDVGLPALVDGRIHATVDTLVEGETYFFAATAYDDTGLASDYSAEITYTVVTGQTVTKTFGNTLDADYPDTLTDTVTNVNDQTHEGATTISTWSWSSPSPHKVANTVILKTDLSAIPATATIVEARIYLYQTTAYGETSYTNTVHKITGKNPVISEVTGYSAAAGSPWDIVPAGTTYDDVPLGLANIAPAEDSLILDGTIGYRSWVVTSMVREWITSPETNYGLLINGQDGMASETGRTFAASENSDTAIRPKLVITYTVDDSVPPAAANSTASGNEDTAITGALDVSNPSTLPLQQYAVTTAPAQGTLTIEDATGQFTYQPQPNFNGQDSFSFTAANDNGTSNTATVTITVNPVNDQPAAQNAEFSTSEDIALNGQLNATDIDGNTLAYSLASQAGNGTAVINADGTFSYTPAANWNGTDTFSFTVNDGAVSSNSATVTVTVNDVNDLPSVAAASLTTNEDTAVNGQLSATDADQDSLTYALSTQAAHGVATVDLSGSYAYTPAANWHGTDSFSFTANDGAVDSSSATVTVTVNSVNDLPSAADTSLTTNEDAPVNGQLSATDIDQDSLTYSLTAQAGKGTVTVNTNGTFTYTPAADWNGSDSFSFTANDGAADSNVAAVTITVAPVNDIPVANDQSVAVDAGVEFNGRLTAADQEGNSLSFAIVAAPSAGTVTFSSDGSFTYTAEQTAEGSDSFTFKANDGSGDSNTATVSISITKWEPTFRFELTEIQADSTWQSVTFETPFTNPVVIARTSSFNNGETGVIRVQNVTATGLELRFQEWDSLNDQHPAETITLMVVEQGSFTLDNGAMVEAGCFTAGNAADFSTITFQQGMGLAPVVMTAVNTVNEDDAVTTRIRNITTTGFEFMLREQELNPAKHAEETACYLAWEPSMGTLDSMQYEVAATDDQITGKAYTISYSSQFIELPLTLAAMQSTDGADTAILRTSSATVQNLRVFVSEEQSRDSEINHTTEGGGYIAVAAYNPLGDPDNDGLRTSDEEDLYNTHPGLADTDNDGMNDGAEITFWESQGSSWDSDIDNDGLINLLDQDADNDGMSDGSEVASGFDPADPSSFPAFPIMEGGEVNVDSTLVHVTLNSTFAKPVVIARLISRNDSEPCVVRVHNVTSNSFDLQLQEYDYLDGNHATELVSYLVVEAGHYTLADGTQVEAGTFSTSATVSYDTRNFSQSFVLTPVVITSVASFNETDTVTARIRNIGQNSFELKLQEQEINAKNHVSEDFAYIAWEPSSGSENGIQYEVARSADAITHAVSTLDYTADFTADPLLYTDMQTTDGGDTAILRTVSNGPNSLEVMVEEEQSRDDETAHTTEVAGFIAILAQ